MRLSDVKGDRVFDVIADIIEPISNIAEDENAAKLFKRERLPEGMTPQSFFLQRLKSSLPAIMKKHKKDIVSILSTIEGVSAEAYSKDLDLVKLVHDVTELLTDEAFTKLFISGQSETSSGVASENTTGQEA